MRRVADEEDASPVSACEGVRDEKDDRTRGRGAASENVGNFPLSSISPEAKCIYGVRDSGTFSPVVPPSRRAIQEPLTGVCLYFQ